MAGFKPGKEIMLGLDCASSEFFKDGIYDYSIFEGVNGIKRNSDEQVNYLQNLTQKYPILSIEDGMDEDRIIKRYEIKGFKTILRVKRTILGLMIGIFRTLFHLTLNLISH